MRPISDAALLERVSAALGVTAVAASRLSGGCVGDVRKVTLDDGVSVVAKAISRRGAKVSDDNPLLDEQSLEVEAFMLRWLAERTALPAPRVLHAEDDLLVMTFIEGASEYDAAAEQDAAERLAALHAIAPAPQGKRFGFERDTLLGALHQPNAPNDSWVFFFREQRLLYMAEAAERERRLPPGLMRRVLAFAARLGEMLPEPASQSVIHGDVWSGNVLARGGRVAAFLDPALCVADAEIELAFIALFGTFGRVFFERYHELRPIAAGFADGLRPRRDIYNLYPLLVHARLFDERGGGPYASKVAATLGRMGF